MPRNSQQVPVGRHANTVFVIDADGWYGMLSLTAPPVRMTDRPDWQGWLRRLTGSGALNRVSCVQDIACWSGGMFLNDPARNGLATEMLDVLAVSRTADLYGTVVFTHHAPLGDGTAGLGSEQMAAVAAAYRRAQQSAANSL